MSARTPLKYLALLVALGSILVKIDVGPLVSTAAAQGPASQPGNSRFQHFFTQRENVKVQKVPPIKLFDNLYFVGIGWVASYVITTNRGLIVIDTLYGPFVDHLIDGIRKLGLDPKDIKYALPTHAHWDHMGGAAQIQQAYGAKVGMLEADWRFFETSGPGNSPVPVRAPRKDLVIKHGDTLTLGTTALKFYALPGHTPGVLGVECTLYDGAKPFKAFLDGALVIKGEGAKAEEQYFASVRQLERMEDVQVFLPMHWTTNDFWDRADKLAQRQPGDQHPFVDPEGFRTMVRNLRVAPIRQ